MKFTCHVHKVLIVIKIIVKQSPWQKRVPKLLLHLVGNMRVTGPNLGSWGNPLPSCHKQTKYYKRISSKDPKWVFNDQIHWTIKVIEKILFHCKLKNQKKSLEIMRQKFLNHKSWRTMQVRKYLNKNFFIILYMI